MSINNTSLVIKPSQFLNIGYYLATMVSLYFGVLPLVILSVCLTGWKVLETHCTSWTLNHDDIIEKKGVLNINTNQIHYFRIKDVTLYQPLLYRLVGIFKLTIVTSDKTKPLVLMNGIYRGKLRMETFKMLATSTRNEMGVKEFDIR